MQNLPPIKDIPSELSQSAQAAQKASVEFGETVEKILIKYGKKIAG
jgi:hypothetical protein